MKNKKIFKIIRIAIAFMGLLISFIAGSFESVALSGNYFIGLIPWLFPVFLIWLLLEAFTR